MSSAEYGEYTRGRLGEDGKAVLSSPDDFDHIGFDAPSIAQMVLIAMLLRSRIWFVIGGAYGFSVLPDGHYDPHFTFLDTRSLDSMPQLWCQYHPISPKQTLNRNVLSQTVGSLEPYYRPLTWTIDRLAVALKHFWDAFTTNRLHHNFVSLTVALECVLTTRDIEVTHLIAERAACLTGKNAADRLQIYQDVRRIYAERSKIVHGQGVPKRGPLNRKDVLVVSPKVNLIPEDVHRKLIAVSIDLLSTLLVRREYLEIIRSGNSEDTINKHLDTFFVKLLLK